MNKCTGCGWPIEGDYEISLVETFEEKDVWIYKFHGWRCLAEFLIGRGMVKVSLRGVGREESGV